MIFTLSIQTYILIIIAFLLEIVWSGGFKFLYTNPRFTNKFTLYISSLLNINPAVVSSSLLTFYYLTAALTGSILISLYSGCNVISLFLINGNYKVIPITLLGAFASFSLTSLGFSMLYVIFPHIDIVEEINKIRWISGIKKLPKNIAFIVPALSACAEELFFRGVLLNALIKNGFSFWLSLTIVTILFVYGQVILTDTKIQALVISISSFVISIIGGLLFITTGSIISSMIVHASFAGFYTQSNNKKEGKVMI
ncbi:CPBP family intramembrane metalloprotease [Aceticella autotrophica]|uniref:CPBP family intramembrane metalloprotease n=1 Tax=Aceticella autotrophica TaxID=2755338 RepID=A0A975AVG9_9THEO|nr:CPBP family glutamic-type intramembrane protease [Aceticella autotrophica]QSZ27197.1 CPBP family intramembrane metalloprotease [Aceticella autotrophica]